MMKKHFMDRFKSSQAPPTLDTSQSPKSPPPSSDQASLPILKTADSTATLPTGYVDIEGRDALNSDLDVANNYSDESKPLEEKFEEISNPPTLSPILGEVDSLKSINIAIDTDKKDPPNAQLDEMSARKPTLFSLLSSSTFPNHSNAILSTSPIAIDTDKKDPLNAQLDEMSVRKPTLFSLLSSSTFPNHSNAILSTSPTTVEGRYLNSYTANTQSSLPCPSLPHPLSLPPYPPTGADYNILKPAISNTAILTEPTMTTNREALNPAITPCDLSTKSKLPAMKSKKRYHSQSSLSKEITDSWKTLSAPSSDFLRQSSPSQPLIGPGNCTNSNNITSNTSFPIQPATITSREPSSSNPVIPHLPQRSLPRDYNAQSHMTDEPFFRNPEFSYSRTIFNSCSNSSMPQNLHTPSSREFRYFRSVVPFISSLPRSQLHIRPPESLFIENMGQTHNLGNQRDQHDRNISYSRKLSKSVAVSSQTGIEQSSIDTDKSSPSNPSLHNTLPENTSSTLQGHVCSGCNKEFVTADGLTQHKIFYCTALHRMTYPCSHCTREFLSSGDSEIHERIHTLPYKCPECGKGFSRLWLLQGHMRTHTKEKPYQCEVCRRSFSDRSNLRAHMQIHSEEKKYKCPKCGRSFSRIPHLRKHQNGECA